METVKTIAVLAVLLVVGYLGYQALTRPPQSPTPGEQAADWPKDGDLNINVPDVPREVAGAVKIGDSAGPGTADRGDVATNGVSGGQAVPHAENGDAGLSAAQPREQVGRFVRQDGVSASAMAGSPSNAASISDSQPSGGSPSLPGSSESSQDAAQGAQNAPSAPNGGVRPEFQAFIEAAYQKLDRGEFVNVHQVLSAWFGDDRLTSEENRLLTDLLDQIAGTVIYSRQAFLEPAHVVEPGETLERIADRYGVPAPLLAKINGIVHPEQLSPGQSLKVIHGPFEGRVYLSRGELVLFVQGLYAGRFPVTIGAEANAQPGVYHVCEKVQNPSYFTPTGVISSGDSSNPLGQFWIGLGGRLGIHGPGRGEMEQQPNPPGSLTVSENDIRDVYDILSIGSQITILP